MLLKWKAQQDRKAMAMSFDKILTAVLAGTTLIVAVFGAIYIPAVPGLERDLGRIEGRMGSIDSRLDRFEGRFDRIDTQFGTVGEKLDAIQVDLTVVRKRLVDAETNPADILRMAGLEVTDWYFAARVDDTVYLFPRTKQAEIDLLAAGMKAQEIRPYLKGFKVEPVYTKK